MEQDPSTEEETDYLACTNTPQARPNQPNMALIEQNSMAQLGLSDVSPPTMGDAKKRKILHQQLLLLMHAYKCQRGAREQAYGDSSKPECAQPHCGTMQNILNHLKECQMGTACQVPHCASSKTIIHHWKTGTRPDCHFCTPLK